MKPKQSQEKSKIYLGPFRWRTGEGKIRHTPKFYIGEKVKILGTIAIVTEGGDVYGDLELCLPNRQRITVDAPSLEKIASPAARRALQ